MPTPFLSLQGFVYIFMRLRNYVKYVYDVTIAYPDGIPQSEKELAMGRFPREIHINVKVCDGSPWFPFCCLLCLVGGQTQRESSVLR